MMTQAESVSAHLIAMNVRDETRICKLRVRRESPDRWSIWSAKQCCCQPPLWAHVDAAEAVLAICTESPGVRVTAGQERG